MSTSGDQIRIQPYIPRELQRRLRAQCLRSNCTESAYVAMALQQGLDGTSDWLLLMKRLDRIARALERLQRSEDFLSEAFSAYLLSWFAHTPAVAADADRKAAARASAESRYRDLMQFVVRRFASGHRLIDDLPQEPVANEAELDAVLARVATAAEPKGEPSGRPVPCKERTVPRGAAGS